MSIYMCFSGGLGNQMFQYAFLYGLARGKKMPVVGIMCHSKKEDFRTFSLDCFSLSMYINIKDELDSGLYFKWLRLLKRVLRNLYQIFYKDENKVRNELKKFGIFYILNPYFYDHNIGEMPKYIDGYFQTYKYFEKYSAEIKREFTVKQHPNKINEQKLMELQSCESVCIHVRRGDYVNNLWADELAICDENYFLRGIEEIKCYVNKPIFYVFSNSHDDIEWIKNNWNLGDVKYIDLNNSDYEDLRLMYTCKHFIISNSTYSWWAQYLATNPNKIVVAPNRWNNISTDSESIYMPDWHLIQV